MSNAVYRAKMGMVFQQFNLFNNLNVLDNCVIGQVKVLKEYCVSEENCHGLPGTGGHVAVYQCQAPSNIRRQKQRVAIARALSMEPEARCLMSLPVPSTLKW